MSGRCGGNHSCKSSLYVGSLCLSAGCTAPVQCRNKGRETLADQDMGEALTRQTVRVTVAAPVT